MSSCLNGGSCLFDKKRDSFLSCANRVGMETNVKVSPLLQLPLSSIFSLDENLYKMKNMHVMSLLKHQKSGAKSSV